MKLDLKSISLAAILYVCNAHQLAYLMSYGSLLVAITLTWVTSIRTSSIRIFKLRVL